MTAQKSNNFIARQLDHEARTLGTTITQAAHDLEELRSQLRQSDTISSAAQVPDWAARYVAIAASYLQSRDTDRSLKDLESFGRQCPWVVAASAAALGFVFCACR